MANLSRFGKETRDETLVRTLKTKKHYERHFAQPFANWKALTEKDGRSRYEERKSIVLKFYEPYLCLGNAQPKTVEIDWR